MQTKRRKEDGKGGCRTSVSHPVLQRKPKAQKGVEREVV